MIVTMAIRSQGQHVTPAIGGGVSWPWEKYTADNKNVTRGNVIVSRVTTGAFGAPAPRPSPGDTGHNQLSLTRVLRGSGCSSGVSVETRSHWGPGATLSCNLGWQQGVRSAAQPGLSAAQKLD